MFLVMDTETGGIGAKEHSLLSAAFLVVDENLDLLDALSLMLVPDDRIIKVNPRALKVNKIDLIAHDEIAVCYSEGRKTAESFLKKWGEKEKLEPVGWGLGFDVDTLQEYLIHSRLWNRYISHRAVDLCSVSRMLKLAGKIRVAGGLQETATDLLGECERSPFGAAHTALGDAYLTL